MKISELINTLNKELIDELKEVLEEYGDIKCACHEDMAPITQGDISPMIHVWVVSEPKKEFICLLEWKGLF